MTTIYVFAIYSQTQLFAIPSQLHVSNRAYATLEGAQRACVATMTDNPYSPTNEPIPPLTITREPFAEEWLVELDDVDVTELHGRIRAINLKMDLVR